MSADTLPPIGLDLVAQRFADLDLGELSAEPVCTVLGRADLAGSSRPLPSSAALLRLGEDTGVWVPAPAEPPEPEKGQAPLYQHGDQQLVLPTIRLFVRGLDPEPENASVEYLGLSDWLFDAVARWRFEPAGKKGDPACTLLDQLQREKGSPVERLRGLARFIYYALFGADGPSTVCGLRLPTCPMWLRPAGETPFARNVSRALVVTARLDANIEAAEKQARARAKRLAEKKGTAIDSAELERESQRILDEFFASPAVPSTNLRAAGYRIRPAIECDWGLDPVHTPEGADIRLTGRLGMGVAVRQRKLDASKERLPLSASTARLPFASYNDPRRLLMAANMQVHAVPLTAQEPPRVRMDDTGEDPPGVNLRVAYLAWQGWNHEDAWVLSRSAAERLGTVEKIVQTIVIRAVELAPEVLVKKGDCVKRGQLLVRRRVAPALLCSALEVLASLADLDETMELRPESDDFAPQDGTVAEIETWDLRDRDGIPKDWLVPEALEGAFRTVYRIHIERPLPLAVGDKLANRHGHKGIVGAIVADNEMPRWRDQPLEALIDPISVLNRSNWGQVYEALAGALREPGQSRDVSSLSGEQVLQEAKPAGADAQGCWPIKPPPDSRWLTKEVQAVAGVQYVMRMPHHACDKISGNPLPPATLDHHVRRRSQRLGEMEHWALWAHGMDASAAAETKGKRAEELTPAVDRLGRLLAVAGFSMKVQKGTLLVRRLALGAAPPKDINPLSLIGKSKASKKSKTGAGEEPKSVRPLADLYDALDAVTPEAPAALIFDPPLILPSPQSEGSDGQAETRLRWLPVLPAGDRPPRRLFDGSEEPHELTADLRRIVRLLRKRKTAQPGADESSDPDNAELVYAVRRLMSDAYAAAVGRSATGPFSSKLAYLRRGVLGRRLPHSARATVSPGGTLFLGLDEIGLPPALAHTLFGPGLPHDEKELAEEVAYRRVWLKRDPVLHRWGLLPVLVRVVSGDTIRLPASLLGPLGADFDGDTVALFAALPGAPADTRSCSPPALAWHPLLQEAMFKPGKQYQYGLYRLMQDDKRKAALREMLAGADAPAWPDNADPKKAFSEWVRQAVECQPQGRWWAIIEEHALRALAADPAMDFQLGSVDALANLAVVRCGAAKDLYGEENRKTMQDILGGKSLNIYRLCTDPARIPPDPIADVMVAAKASIGQFGGALRRLVYSAEKLRPDDIQKAQCLTEQVTQKALSVKAGKPPLKYAQFERQLRRLLKQQKPNESEPEDLHALLAEIGKALEPVWKELGALMPQESPPWLEWLRKPHELAELVAAAGEIRLPLDDLRLQSWKDHSLGEQSL